MTDQLSLPRPDDWHVHFRQGDILPVALAASGRCFARCVAMPNLVPPLVDAVSISNYATELNASLAKLETNDQFTPLLTLYLTDDTDPAELDKASKIDNFFAVKYYPRGATTNSTQGVSSPSKCEAVFARMEELDIPLLIHGEEADAECDVFDREQVFLNEQLPSIRDKFPALRITLEHISTKAACDYLRAANDKTAATITPQHLLYNRNAMLGDKLNPHLFCKPILKREADRQALCDLVSEGFPRVFLGSDSAPHLQHDKESPCGCAGVFSAPYLIEIITDIFDKLDALDKLPAFVAENGARHYGFAPATDEITLVKRPTKVPASIATPLSLIHI